MNNWYLGGFALFLWLGATLMYLRRPFGEWLKQRRADKAKRP